MWSEDWVRWFWFLLGGSVFTLVAVFAVTLGEYVLVAADAGKEVWGGIFGEWSESHEVIITVH